MYGDRFGHWQFNHQHRPVAIGAGTSDRLDRWHSLPEVIATVPS